MPCVRVFFGAPQTLDTLDSVMGNAVQNHVREGVVAYCGTADGDELIIQTRHDDMRFADPATAPGPCSSRLHVCTPTNATITDDTGQFAAHMQRTLFCQRVAWRCLPRKSSGNSRRLHQRLSERTRDSPRTCDPRAGPIRLRPSHTPVPSPVPVPRPHSRARTRAHAHSLCPRPTPPPIPSPFPRVGGKGARKAG